MKAAALTSPLGTEIDWERAGRMLRLGLLPDGLEYIYAIGEQPDGPVKIGRARDPVKRLRTLQTGNPRRLRIECLVVGDSAVERMLHEYWREHVIGGNARRSELNAQYARDTEWFSAEAREEVLTAMGAIAERHWAPRPEDEDYVTVTAEVMTDLGYEIRRGDTVRRLGRFGGHVVQGLRA